MTAQKARKSRTDIVGGVDPDNPVIGFVMGDPVNPFHGEYLRGAKSRAAASGYLLMVGVFDWDTERLLPLVEEMKKQGALGCVVAVTQGEAGEVQDLASPSFPLIMLNQTNPGPHVTSLVSNFYSVGETVARHLVSAGCTNLGIIHNHASIDGRCLGFIDEVERHGLSVPPEAQGRGMPTTEGGFAATAQMLASGATFDGLFAYNDLMGIGAMEALTEAGIEVPHQCAVVGCDGIELSALVRPPLSTVAFDPAAEGFRAMTEMISYVTGEKDPGGVTELPRAGLVVRESSDVGLAEISNRLPTLGRLTGGIVHDFNNTLMVLRGVNELLSIEASDELTKSLLEAADSSITRAEVLTRQLSKMFNRPTAGSATDLDSFLERLIPELNLAVGAAHTVTRGESANGGRIVVDASMFESTLLNLVLNASQASPGGQILVHDGPAAKVTSRLHESWRDFWSIDVQDFGPGIEPEVKDRIFDPFYSQSPGGSGLGLAIARSFLWFSGGDIELLDAAIGAYFRLYLPVSLEGPIPATTGSQNREGAERLSVALVDDDRPVRNALELMIEAMQCDVSSYGNATEVRMAISDGAQFDVLVTDLLMPGENGVSLSAHVRRRMPDCSIIFLSGNPSHFASHQEPDLVSAIVLSKPVRFAELEAAVRRTPEGSVA